MKHIIISRNNLSIDSYQDKKSNQNLFIARDLVRGISKKGKTFYQWRLLHKDKSFYKDHHQAKTNLENTLFKTIPRTHVYGAIDLVSSYTNRYEQYLEIEESSNGSGAVGAISPFMVSHLGDTPLFRFVKRYYYEN